VAHRTDTLCQVWPQASMSSGLGGDGNSVTWPITFASSITASDEADKKQVNEGLHDETMEFFDDYYQGDFYQEADEVPRSSLQAPSLPWGDEADLVAPTWWLAKVEEASQPVALVAPGQDETQQEEYSLRPRERQQDRQDVEEAPAQPALLPSIGGHAITSVILHSRVLGVAVVAEDAARCVHDFLQGEAGASVTKVSPRKFSLKATAFHEVRGCLLHCALKMQVFLAAHPPEVEADAGERLVVEFQRRDGDALAFSHLFAAASRHLEAHFGAGDPAVVVWGVADTAAMVPETPATPRILSSPMAASDLQPLADMLANPASPSGQEEAAASLAILAGASIAAALAVCTVLGNLHDVVLTLLAGVRLEASYPAARLVYHLARHGAGPLSEKLLVAALSGAAGACAGIGVGAGIAARGGACTADPLVRFELAEAAHMAAQRCGTDASSSGSMDSASSTRSALAASSALSALTLPRRLCRALERALRCRQPALPGGAASPRESGHAGGVAILPPVGLQLE